MKRNYEVDDATFNADAYQVTGYRSIAWYVRGWEIRPDEDTEWSGIEERTGNIIATMVGDDRQFVFGPDEITPLAREEYCGGCGQMGCGHDGVER